MALLPFANPVYKLSNSILIDTKANILASTKAQGFLAYATDTIEFYLSLGSGSWIKDPFAFVSEPQTPDIGWTQASSKIGYRPTYLTNKELTNVWVGTGSVTSPNTGQLRVINGSYQIYLNGSWQNIVVNFVFREDATWGYTFEHQPIGFGNYIEIMTGDSLNNLGLNGRPLTQGYITSMGAYPGIGVVGGRQFS